MAFKTILVHIADNDASVARIDAAASLAESHGGRLIGLATVAQPTPILVEGSAAAAGIWAAQASEYEAAATRAVDAFTDAMKRRGVSAEARVAGGFEDNAGAAFALSARYADLAVIGGRDASASATLADALIDGALFDAGLPTLMIPVAGASPKIGSKPLIAWDGGMQAGRAARAAFPFMDEAASAVVCVAKTYLGMGRHGAEPGADVGRWLAAHDVEVTVETLDAKGGVSDALFDAAQRHGCDLIVMGAFGHSRLRESLFGGVTQDMVSAPRIPLLLAH